VENLRSLPTHARLIAPALALCRCTQRPTACVHEIGPGSEVTAAQVVAEADRRM
jgi:hypothetical protein